MKFFEFTQNNSGGSFVCDEKLTHRVFIEANDADEATRIGEDLGMYWGGCENNMDCPCCGDRWYRPWRDEGVNFPYEYASFTKKDADAIALRYNVEVRKIDSKKNTYGRDYAIVFSTPEIYAQYLADDYGWCNPDAYIYYKSGRKVSIVSNNSNRVKR